MVTAVISEVISHNDFTGPGTSSTKTEEQKMSRDPHWQKRNAMRGSFNIIIINRDTILEFINLNSCLYCLIFSFSS